MFLFLILMSNAAWSKIYLVTNNNDSGPNSFRQAILDANVNVGKDTIEVTISDTILIETAWLPGISLLPSVADTLCIFGNGVVLNAVVPGRIIELDKPCEINSILFIGGTAFLTGGGVRTSAEAKYCVFNSCAFVSNHAPGNGGGLYTDCDTELNNCFFEGNSATDGGGLAIRYDVQVCMNNCTFKNNTITGDGGAIWLWGSTLTIKTANFENTTGPFDQDIYIKFSALSEGNVILGPGFEVPAGSGFSVIYGL